MLINAVFSSWVLPTGTCQSPGGLSALAPNRKRFSPPRDPERYAGTAVIYKAHPALKTKNEQRHFITLPVQSQGDQLEDKAREIPTLGDILQLSLDVLAVDSDLLALQLGSLKGDLL